MSGIRQTQNRIAPYNATAPSGGAAPTVQTQRMGMVDQTSKVDTSGLSQLAGAFDNFFNAGQRILMHQAQQDQEMALRQIEQENKDLGEMAQADRLAGRERDPNYMGRRSYLEAYDKTEAVLSAQKFSDELHDTLANAAKDGSVDPDGIYKALFDKRFGKGTGNTTFDAEFLLASKKLTDHSMAQFREARRQTILGNNVDKWRESLTGLLSTPDKLTPEEVNGSFQRVLQLTMGNVKQAEDLMVSTLSASVRNPEQAEKALKAFESAGFAQTHPATYQEMSKHFAQNIQHPGTLEGVNRWAHINQTMVAMLADPQTTLDDLASLRWQAQDAFYKHGGLANLNQMTAHLTSEMMQRAQKQANVNLVYLTLTSDGTTLESNMTAYGVTKSAQEQVDKDFFPVLNVMSREQPDFEARFPALTQTKRPDGTYNFLANPAASKQMAQVLTQSTRMFTALGGLIPSHIRNDVMLAMRNHGDPAQAEAAFEFMRELHARAPSRYQFDTAVKDQEMVSLFDVINDATKYGNNLTPKDLFKKFADNPDLFKKLEGLRKGDTNWNQLLGDTSKTNSEREAEVDKKLNEAATKWFDDRPWWKLWGGDKANIPYGDVRRQLKAQVLQNAYHQLLVTGSVDLDKAVEHSTTTLKSRFVPLPGQKGRLTIVEDPFAGRGRKYNEPLGTYNGQQVYAPFPVINAFGEEERPLETYREDVEQLVKTFPTTHATSGNDVALIPDNTKTKGLFLVADKTGVPLRFVPGSAFEGGKTIPKDKKQAFDFLMANLPKGFQVQEDVYGGQTAFRVLYGFRLKKGPEAEKAYQEELTKKRATEFNKNRVPIADWLLGKPDSERRK